MIGYLHVAEHHEEAERLLAAFQPAEDPTVIANLAWIAACKNDLDACVRMLDRAKEICDREWLSEFCRMDVEFDRFRDDERFHRAVS